MPTFPLASLFSLFIGARTIVFDLTIDVNKIIQLIKDSTNPSARFFCGIACVEGITVDLKERIETAGDN